MAIKNISKASRAFKATPTNKRMAKAQARRVNRASKADLVMAKAKAKNMKISENVKLKKHQTWARTVSGLGAEVMGAYAVNQGSVYVDKLTPWNKVIDSNPQPDKGQDGDTQGGSTTEIDSTTGDNGKNRKVPDYGY